MVTFIDQHRHVYGVEPICAILPIAPSTYFLRKVQQRDSTKRSTRARRDDELRAAIQRVWTTTSRSTGRGRNGKLCGACPVPASTGVTNRHRLFRGGHRQANAALYRIVTVRMRWHQPTIDYVSRRTAEGLSRKDIIRCLKRFVAREIYHAIMKDHAARQAAASPPAHLSLANS